MAVDEKWYFTKEQLLQSPSRKSGYDVDKELSCRQQAANFIQDMGQRLQVSQLCINTAIVYMHRFYVFHSLAAFHRNAIAAAALFLAAKVEEQPRKLEHVIKVAHLCLHRENPNLDTKSELYLEQAQDLVFNENVLLQTLGFDVAIDHPHTHVVRCCQLVRASKDLAQTSYFMASNSLHLTTMCLQYKPTVVACFCIHLACKWSNWEIPRSNEGKDWFWYIDKTVTVDLLEQLTAEFLAILDKCPTKLKRKMMSMNQNNTPGFTQQTIPNDSLHFEEPRKLTGSEANKPPEGLFPIQKSNSQSSNETKPGTSTSVSSASTAQTGHAHHQKIDYREYREKKERERIEREKQQQQHQRDGHNMSSNNHHHHAKSGIIPGKNHSNIQSRSSSGSVSHKSYQQLPHGVQQNVHFQNLKEGRESSSQGFQSSSTKDGSYLKQHPPHGERGENKDNASFHGQYSQSSSNTQQKINYSGNYPHREGSRGSHNVQNSGNSSLPQTHHNQSQNLVSNSSNLMSNSRETLIGSQRESAIVKDSDSQPQSKDSMSSSIRDIIGQSVSQKDVHSMTNERKDHIRDKSRVNYIHGSSSSTNFRPESVKSGREQMGLNFHDTAERKLDDFSKLKDKPIKKEEEPVIETVKLETMKQSKFDESEVGDESWSFGMGLSNVSNEKNNMPIHIKSEIKIEPGAGKHEFSVESNLDSFTLNKAQSMHPAKMMDPKYKGHHYHSSSKNSDISQIKTEKTGAQSSSDFNKKPNDRLHEKHRKPQELERVSNTIEGMGCLNETSKHHKLVKEGSSEKHKIMLAGQHGDQRIKEKLSPTKYQKMKALQRPSNLGYVKSEPSHFSLDTKSSNSAGDSDRIEGANQPLSLKSVGPDDTNKNIGNTNSFQKQKSHEFGAPGNLSSSLPDQNFVKSSKTSSIFSPDSKIPPQNVLNSLEKDSKKNISSAHRSSQQSNKTPPDSVKKSVPTAVLGTITTSTTSTTGSLFSPPLPKNVPSAPPSRHRTSSSGSEPELIPVLTKLEETPGYENIMRERKIALTPTNSSSPNEKDKKSSGLSEKTETGNAFLFDFDHKINTKDSKSNDALPNEVKSEVLTQSVVSKPVVNVKFPNEIRSDLGAVIYPNNPKSTPVSKPSQGFTLAESKLSLANSVSTVNLLGIEKMVDTSISPAKQSNQFGSVTTKSTASNPVYNSATSVNTFAPSVIDQTEKMMNDQKSNTLISGQDSADVDVLGYSEKKRSEKKKKKEKHKHKEKDKSERKKEKKKHKDKDKERTKEKDKHKDKEKHKEKHRDKEIDVVSSETPIKITIPKDKISGSLKIKISKDCLKKDDIEPPKPNTSGELKIKISKDVFSTYKEESKNDSRKRERSPKSSSELPQPKALKTSDKKSSASSLKPNGMEGSSRNSNSHRYSVSENDSCFDISSLYDCPFEFEENGQGIIKTPDYDFESLNASEFPQESNTSPDIKEIEDCDKNSHNESEISKDNDRVATGGSEGKSDSPKEVESCYIDDSCGDIAADLILKSVSPLKNVTSSEYFLGEALKTKTCVKPATINESQFDTLKRDETVDDLKYNNSNKVISLKNCDVLKNYKTILDSHSRRCDSEILRHSVSPFSPEENAAETNSNDDNNNKNTDGALTNNEKMTPKLSKSSFDTENPNYYNKYFKKDSGSRISSRDEKWMVKEKSRFEDRRYYEKRRYRADHNDRDRRDERRFYREYRDYGKDASQYYYERLEERRFDYPEYSGGQPYFATPGKTENNLAAGLNYELNATVYQGCQQTKTGPKFPQICETSLPGNSSEMNVPYQYGYFNNYMYPPNGGYRFYGNVPFVNVSIMHQQPIPPGTGDPSVVQLEPPPLPLEPPPDLPPPPETPPPPPK